MRLSTQQQTNMPAIIHDNTDQTRHNGSPSIAKTETSDVSTRPRS